MTPLSNTMYYNYVPTIQNTPTCRHNIQLQINVYIIVRVFSCYSIVYVIAYTVYSQYCRGKVPMSAHSLLRNKNCCVIEQSVKHMPIVVKAKQ